ncbi:cysteine-rich CWC family protein [Polluticoccus soli]|uniref:cysteine-rich CWC family protein n=1 Tax=Polluticoccus soli TaxID=3034150 RepID=UPI0023E2CCA3|nr:cysteine-rich CWC family protein [Flavipsychrobacter sp. JY13-12]
MTEKRCSKCGKPFGCKADERGCWCENLTLSTETLVQLKAEYDNCLCPDCLATYQESSQQTSGGL